MKAIIKSNFLENQIANEQAISVLENLNDPFFGQFVKEDTEVSITLQDVNVLFSGYGHWKITVKMEVNNQIQILTTTTTDSEAVDNKDYLSLFTECMNDNEEKFYEILDKTEVPK